MAKPVVCIICGKEKPGIPVKEDRILRAMRWIKRNVTKNEKDNLLVVCREDWPKYDKARRKFTTRMALYVALGIVFVVVGCLIAFSLYTLAITLLVLLLFYLLSLLNYMPALDLGKKGHEERARGQRNK